MFPGSSAVEQPAVNRLVAGSNPARGAKQNQGIRPTASRWFRGQNSVGATSGATICRTEAVVRWPVVIRDFALAALVPAKMLRWGMIGAHSSARYAGTLKRRVVKSNRLRQSAVSAARLNTAAAHQVGQFRDVEGDA